MERILKTNLKILIITQYFWPENFRVNELSEELTKLGHQITILTGYPNYPKGDIYQKFKSNFSKYTKYKGVEIIRVPILPRKKTKINLILNYSSFLVNSILIGFFKLKGKNFDIILTYQLSPVTVGITSAFFSFIKNCPNIFWIFDLWPDTLIALNILKKRWQITISKILVNMIYSRCDVILTQSKSILKEINNYSSVKNNAYYLPSWGESELFFEVKKPAPEINLRENIFTIIFAGNIGEAQDFPNIIKAVKHLSLKNIEGFRIVIIGEGSKKEWLKKEIKKLKIEKYFDIYKSYPMKRMGSFFLHADALLVSLSNKKVFNMTIPGKVQFYLSSGIPIIGMISGEGAKLIKKSKAGFVCNSSDYLGLAEIIQKIIILDKKDLQKIGLRGKLFADKEFSKKNIIKILNKLLIKTYKNKLTKTNSRKFLKTK